MWRNRLVPVVRRFFSIVTLTLVLASTAPAAAKYGVLHDFDCPTDGCGPNAGVVFDATGDAYGTTGSGGSGNCNLGCGTIFKLTPPSGGAPWTLSVLHNLTLSEGDAPFAAVTFDQSGNLYGTAIGGGAYDSGTVFELISGSSGWTLSVLHSFGSGNDGWKPFADVVLDKAGNLYGTTQGSTVYKLAPSSDGSWTENTIYNFTAKDDGSTPEAGLIWDQAGSLYGTTVYGGGYYSHCSPGCGTVFKLVPTSGGGWKEHILHRFNWAPGGPDGFSPYGSVTFDKAGNLYGTTAYGGSDNACFSGCGTIFKLTPLSNGRWKETILHFFHLDQSGYAPFAAVVLDEAGNVYGTTAWGGVNNAGVVFKLSPGANGKWKYSVLHRFTGPDGAQSNAGLIFDKSGKHLYGTTSLGGAHNGGVVFEITP